MLSVSKLQWRFYRQRLEKKELDCEAIDCSSGIFPAEQRKSKKELSSNWEVQECFTASGRRDEIHCTAGKSYNVDRMESMCRNSFSKNTCTHRRSRRRCMFPAYREIIQAAIIKTVGSTKATNFCCHFTNQRKKRNREFTQDDQQDGYQQLIRETK